VHTGIAGFIPALPLRDAAAHGIDFFQTQIFVQLSKYLKAFASASSGFKPRPSSPLHWVFFCGSIKPVSIHYGVLHPMWQLLL